MAAWGVYILRCADDSLYTGVTNNLPRRLAAHNAGTAARPLPRPGAAGILGTLPGPVSGAAAGG